MIEEEFYIEAICPECDEHVIDCLCKERKEDTEE